MSQESVFNLLEKSNKPLSLREITKKLDLTSAGRNVRKLMENGDIKMAWVIVERKGYNGSIVKKPVQHYFV